MMAPGRLLAAALLGVAGCIMPDEAGLRDADGDGAWGSVDCDDGDPLVHPDAEERCNGRDDDCDGEVDEAHAIDDWALYVDLDGDGWGDADERRSVCQPEAGLVGAVGDCDDRNPFAYPGAEERCDGEDNDCDEEVDEEGAVDGAPRWLDRDGDGFGNPARAGLVCGDAEGWVNNDLDCDDLRDDVSPAGQEVCDPDDADEDCDGEVEDADPSASGALTWYRDADGDGWGVADDAIETCEPQGWYTADQSGDCDDDTGWRFPRETCTDGDGDGHGVEPVTACLGPDEVLELCDDCDDADAATHPDASETWYDGRDADCDGADDYDADGDDHASEAWGGDDCDDADAEVNPSVATDTLYDGVDANCDDADDYDADLDGYSSSTYGGDDCDDGDADISPAQAEWIGDTVDENCDGAAEVASVIVESVVVSDALGHALGFADADADGAMDLWLGAPGVSASVASGGVWLLAGPIGASASLSGAASWDLGNSTDGGASLDGAADLDGDGYPELLVGGPKADDPASSAGAVWRFDGPATAGGTDADAAGLITGVDSSDRLGAGLSASVDLDDDGLPDLAAGLPGDDAGAPSAGAVAVVYGAWTGTLSATGADAAVVGTVEDGDLGDSLASLADHDGDGIDELLIGAPGGGTSCAPPWVGIAPGPVEGTVSQADVDVQLTASTCESEAGAALLGQDLDGDGYADLAIGAPESDLTGRSLGAVYVHLGPVVTGALEGADLSIAGVIVDGEAGESLAAGDLDGDGAVDLAIGGPLERSSSTDRRHAWVLFGVSTGSVDLACSDAVACLLAGTYHRLGAAAAVHDLDGDGRDELVLGVPYIGSSSTTMSALWLFEGSRW